MSALAPVYDPDQISPGWLTQVLSAAGAIGGREVVAVESEPVGTGQVGCNIRCRLRYNVDGPGPDSVMLKFASRDPASQSAGIQTKTYETEVAFYQELADTVDISRPTCWYAAVEPGTAQVVLVLADIPGTVGDQLAGCGTEQAVLAVTEAARLHGPRWGDPRLAEVGWLAEKAATFTAPGPLLAMVWPTFLERMQPLLSPESLEVGARLSAATTWSEPEPDTATLCHCDYRLDNMLFASPDAHPDRPLTVLDWQTVRLGTGTSDVSYFLGAAMPPEQRRVCEKDLVARYHAALSQYDIGDYDLDRCWDDYRRHSFGGFFMAVFAGVMVQRTERGDAMFATMANGAAAQAVDLDAFDFLV